jgi:hypothetical protein
MCFNLSLPYPVIPSVYRSKIVQIVEAVEIVQVVKIKHIKSFTLCSMPYALCPLSSDF